MCREELIDFDKYIFSKDGKIISKHWNKLLPGWIDKDGYLVSCLTLKNGKRQPYRVNRVIAYLFVAKPEHLKNIPYEELQVGHSDINKKNNNSYNLYWCTSKENNNNPLTKEKQIGKVPWNKGVKKYLSNEHIECLRKKSSKPVNQFKKDGTFVKRWDSAKQAGNELNICPPNITNCCKGKAKTAGGFKWIYEEGV